MTSEDMINLRMTSRIQEREGGRGVFFIGKGGGERERKEVEWERG